MNDLPIQTRDNFSKELLEEEVCHLNTLKKLAEPTISNLCFENNPNLLVFPQNLEVYGDKIGDTHIFEIKDGKILTGNIMGFIGCGKTKVSISSRFTQDKEDYFLHYMLQKVFSINLFDLQFNSDEDNIFDFLLYLFPSFLNRAMQQGIYREYQTRQYNNSNVKGRVDVARHISQNIPFASKIAYSTREYALDNHLTELIRHTIEYIIRHPFGGNILHNDENVIDAVKRICQVTTAYDRNKRQEIINQNLRPINHPYYSEYIPLQQLCLQILRQEEMKYGRDNDEIYGILFDGAWLWEEYLNTILADIGFNHPRNKERIGYISLFTDGSGWCFPDFYNSEIILDAKYKWYNSWNKVQTDDLYQVITYMHVMNLEKGGYIAPIQWDSTRPTIKTLKGKGGSMSIIGMRVQQLSNDFKSYCRFMEEQESKLVKDIKSIL